MTVTYIDPAGKLMGHLGKLTMLQNGDNPWPINIEIDLSNRCSLGCEWCHFAFTHTRGPLAGKREKPAGAIPGGDLMDTGLALSLVQQVSAANERGGRISLTWTGGGEPTLHPAFAEIVERAHDLGVPQGLYTHGGHITEELAAVLKRTMRFVYVSLDATTPEGYKKLKGIDRFQKACDGIRHLYYADGPATVGLGMLVGAHTGQGIYTDDIRRAADLAARHGADYVQYRPIVSFDVHEEGIPSDDRGWIDRVLPDLERVAYFRGNVQWDRERFEMLRDWTGHGYETCFWSALQTVVTPNGSMWSCVNKREHPAALIGDLTADTFEAIWGRRPLAKVDGSCRVMCRGHIANVTLDRIMAVRPHPEFV